MSLCFTSTPVVVHSFMSAYYVDLSYTVIELTPSGVAKHICNLSYCDFKIDHKIYCETSYKRWWWIMEKHESKLKEMEFWEKKEEENRLNMLEVAFQRNFQSSLTPAEHTPNLFGTNLSHYDFPRSLEEDYICYSESWNLKGKRYPSINPRRMLSSKMPHTVCFLPYF